MSARGWLLIGVELALVRPRTVMHARSWHRRMRMTTLSTVLVALSSGVAIGWSGVFGC